MLFREYFYCNYMWTTEKLKSLLKKIKSPTVESELFQISNNLELLFVLEYSQFEKSSLSNSWRNNYSCFGHRKHFK